MSAARKWSCLIGSRRGSSPASQPRHVRRLETLVGRGLRGFVNPQDRANYTLEEAKWTTTGSV
jgi:hypothetical protein